LRDELSSRKSLFRQGRPIRLADRQSWTVPAPPRGSEWKAIPFADEYTDLIRAILEAEDGYEQGLAELAFAVLLLGHNYRLSPADYESLLDFVPESPESRAWQDTFHQIAQDHLHSYLDFAGVSAVDRSVLDAPRRLDRLFAWLRNRLPSRWFSLESRR
jgi:hypothetical protein